jgi:catechol 2,3-dioxygenase-like lactoylglutathione lyase family enzyme
MIHHVTFGTNDVERARHFYDPLMDLLGLRRLKTNDGGVHYGTGQILFSVVTTTNGRPATAGNGTHVAFQARDHEMVRKRARVA